MDLQELTSEKIAFLKKNFNKHGFAFSYFATSQGATEYLQKELAGKTIGFGDSETMASMELYALLSSTNDVIDPMHRPSHMTFKEAGQKALNRDVFLSSANALTEDGYLLNMDGTGNRVAGTLFSAQAVYFICGYNKLVPNIEAGLQRIRTVAGPLNTRRKNLKTPCAKLEQHCYNCQAIDRICNALVIYYHKMRNVEKMEVILIGESLGL